MCLEDRAAWLLCCTTQKFSARLCTSQSGEHTYCHIAWVPGTVPSQCTQAPFWYAYSTHLPVCLHISQHLLHHSPVCCLFREKAEIQALSSFGFQYLTQQYLPKKLAAGDWC